MNTIRILFFNKDKGGVNYFRTETPAVELNNQFSDVFNVNIKNNLKGKTKDEIVEELSNYDIIHYHRTFVNNTALNAEIMKDLKSKGIKLILDIDDYWELDRTHPLYLHSINLGLKENTIQNIKDSDYVTTTTEVFKREIEKYNPNVFVLFNSVNPEQQPQFRDNNKFDRKVVNITYIGGSSHLYDLEILRGVTNILKSDNTIKNKFKIVLGGFDTNGTIDEKQINPDFIKILKMLNLYNNNIMNQVKKYNGDINKIKEIPQNVKDIFKNGIFKVTKRNIKPNESVYYKYENILTDNYNLINDNQEYFNYLNKFVKDKYVNEDDVQYIRRWTCKPNEYAKILDETDILIAPLLDTKFNNMKSNLKQLEASTRKLPIVCSDVVPYNVDGNNSNCILIKHKKNQEKDWAKALKKLILDSDLRKELGNNLYNDFNNKYNLINVTKSRADLYKMIVNNTVYV